MTFKMKGSAFKLGKVATKSALKNSGAAYATELKKSGDVTDEKRLQNLAKSHNDNFAPGHTEHTGEQNEPQPGSKEYKRRKKAEKAKEDSGVKMKSPAKQTIEEKAAKAAGGGLAKKAGKTIGKQIPDISLMKEKGVAKKVEKGKY